MTQYRKGVFDLGEARHVSDPHEAEARAREASMRAETSLAHQLMRMSNAQAAAMGGGGGGRWIGYNDNPMDDIKRDFQAFKADSDMRKAERAAAAYSPGRPSGGGIIMDGPHVPGADRVHPGMADPQRMAFLEDQRARIEREMAAQQGPGPVQQYIPATEGAHVALDEHLRMQAEEQKRYETKIAFEREKHEAKVSSAEADRNLTERLATAGHEAQLRVAELMEKGLNFRQAAKLAVMQSESANQRQHDVSLLGMRNQHLRTMHDKETSRQSELAKLKTALGMDTMKESTRLRRDVLRDTQEHDRNMALGDQIYKTTEGAKERASRERIANKRLEAEQRRIDQANRIRREEKEAAEKLKAEQDAQDFFAFMQQHTPKTFKDGYGPKEERDLILKYVNNNPGLKGIAHSILTDSPFAESRTKMEEEAPGESSLLQRFLLNLAETTPNPFGFNPNVLMPSHMLGTRDALARQGAQARDTGAMLRELERLRKQ